MSAEQQSIWSSLLAAASNQTAAEFRERAVVLVGETLFSPFSSLRLSPPFGRRLGQRQEPAGGLFVRAKRGQQVDGG